MAFDPLGLKRAMDPEAVEPGFLNDDDRKAFPGPRLFPEFCKPRQQAGDVAGRHRMFRHLRADARRQRGDQPLRAQEFQRDEDCAKLGADSGRHFGSVCCCNVHACLQGKVLFDATSRCHSAGRYPPVS